MFNYYIDRKLYLYLQSQKILSKENLEILDIELENTPELLSDIIIDKNFLTQHELDTIKAKLYNTSYYDIKRNLKLFNFKIAEILWMKENKVFPLYQDQEIIYIAMDDPENFKVIDAIKNILKNYTDIAIKIHIYYAPSSQILLRWTQIEGILYNDIKEPLEKLIYIFDRSLAFDCSDIHFHPQKNYIEVSFRISGILKRECILSKEQWNIILNRLKVLANLDVTESRKPQSGHCKLTILETSVDLRMSTHPSVYGENLVIRLLKKDNQLRSIQDLGFDEDILLALDQVIHQPQGLFIITGPTGSGKTSTLYAILQEIKKTNKSIMTLESPVECYIPGIKQTEIREGSVMDYAEGIRSILRQDPDVILIGEIRDEETVKMAVRAAMTGHFVIATMHTNDTLGVPLRLKELGVTDQLMEETLTGVLSQRLVRVLCQLCKDRSEKCQQCTDDDFDYSHRAALGEVLLMDNEWAALFKHSSRTKLEEKRKTQKILSLRDRMKLWIERGNTTQEESDRVLGIEQCKQI